MALQILSTKLYIPALRQSILSRPRLLDHLNSGTTGKLTLISAPAGYGKTTLVNDWVIQSNLQYGWLSLDLDDNDLKQFLAYIIASLETIPIKVGEEIPSLFESQTPNKYKELLIRLINRISDTHRRFVLVLDDYHLIHNDEIHDVLIYLLDHLPSNMHLIVVSRTDPPIRLAQLRAQGELCEIRAADLRFSLDEGIGFLNQKLELDLPLSDIKLINNKTEGWIAGLQLAAISLKKHPDKHGFVNAFAGDDSHIADFLFDEVLRQQPAYIQTFLLQISFLDQFCASLCDAVTGRDDSRMILEELERSNLFLVPLDHQRKWFRFHQLFADLLSISLKNEKQDSEATLYRRASSWYEDQQMLSEAVRLALMGNDTEKVLKLMEGHLLEIVSKSELTKLNRLLASLPKDTINSNPFIALAMAWGKSYVWQFNSAELLLDKAASNLDGLDEITQNRLQGRILVLQSYIAGSKRAYKNSIQIAKEALRLLPNDDLSMRSFSLLIIGNAYRFEGNLKHAIKFHNDALGVIKGTRDINLSVIILSRITELYKLMGKLNRAQQAGLQALDMIERWQGLTGSESFTLGYLNLRLSSIYYERNDLENALKFAETGYALVKAWGAYDSISHGYFCLAKIHQAMGNYDLAIAYLNEFKDSYPWEDRLQYQFASAHQAEIHLRVGKIKEAEAWAASFRKKTYDSIQFLDFLFYDVLAQVFIEKDQLDEAQSLLEMLLVTSKQAGTTQLEAQTLARWSLVHKKVGDPDAAIVMLEKALALLVPEDYLRTFMDMGDDMAELIYQASLQGVYPGFCKQIMDEYSSPAAFVQDSPVLVEPLSLREIEILSRIADGRTNQEIAEKLVISLYTVKTHAGNIYGKLGVKNRTEAVAKARFLGILPRD